MEKAGGAPAARLAHLLRLATSHRAAGLESALRAWGAADGLVSTTLARVDASVSHGGQPTPPLVWQALLVMLLG